MCCIPGNFLEYFIQIGTSIDPCRDLAKWSEMHKFQLTWGCGKWGLPVRCVCVFVKHARVYEPSYPFSDLATSVVVVQSPSHVWLLVTPGNAACQAYNSKMRKLRSQMSWQLPHDWDSTSINAELLDIAAWATTQHSEISPHLFSAFSPLSGT